MRRHCVATRDARTLGQRRLGDAEAALFDGIEEGLRHARIGVVAVRLVLVEGSQELAEVRPQRLRAVRNSPHPARAGEVGIDALRLVRHRMKQGGRSHAGLARWLLELLQHVLEDRTPAVVLGLEFRNLVEDHFGRVSLGGRHFVTLLLCSGFDDPRRCLVPKASSRVESNLNRFSVANTHRVSTVPVA